MYGTPSQEQHGLWRDVAHGDEAGAAVGDGRATRPAWPGHFAPSGPSCGTRSRATTVPTSALDVLLTWGTTRFAAVGVRHEPRRLGASNYTFRKLVVHALNMMTGFSTWPLQLASLIGFVFTILGHRRAAVRRGPVRIPGWRRAWVLVPGLDHRHLLRGSAVLARHHRRVPRSHARPFHAAPDLHHPRGGGAPGPPGSIPRPGSGSAGEREAHEVIGLVPGGR